MKINIISVILCLVFTTNFLLCHGLTLKTPEQDGLREIIAEEGVYREIIEEEAAKPCNIIPNINVFYIAYISFTCSCSITVLFPYAAYMTYDYGMVQSKDHAGYYSGFLV